MEDQIRSLTAKVNALLEKSSEVEELRKRCHVLETRNTALENRCTVAEYRHSALENRCTVAENRNAAIETRCSVLESRCADLEAKKSSRNGPPTLSRITSLRSQPHANYGTSSPPTTPTLRANARRTAPSPPPAGQVRRESRKRRCMDLPYLDHRPENSILPTERKRIMDISMGMGFAVMSINRNGISSKEKFSVVVFMEQNSANEYYRNECDTDQQLVFRRKCPIARFEADILEHPDYVCAKDKTKCLIWKSYANRDGSEKSEICDVVAMGLFYAKDQDMLKYHSTEVRYWNDASRSRKSTIQVTGTMRDEVVIRCTGRPIAGIYSDNCVLYKTYRSWLRATGRKP